MEINLKCKVCGNDLHGYIIHHGGGFEDLLRNITIQIPPCPTCMDRATRPLKALKEILGGS